MPTHTTHAIDEESENIGPKLPKNPCAMKKHTMKAEIAPFTILDVGRLFTAPLRNVPAGTRRLYPSTPTFCATEHPRPTNTCKF